VAGAATTENFAKLARQRSTDQGSAASGGSLGSFSEAQFRQQFDPTFVEAALALEPGEISEVIPTQFGFHVIELIRRDVATFDQVREQLSAQQAPQIFQEWLLERYDALDIEVNPRYGRLDGETGEVVAIRSTGDEPAASGATGPAASGATGATAPAP
jgi:parvulin-like peptidyl-prolyl isomerase